MLWDWEKLYIEIDVCTVNRKLALFTKRWGRKSLILRIQDPLAWKRTVQYRGGRVRMRDDDVRVSMVSHDRRLHKGNLHRWLDEQIFLLTRICFPVIVTSVLEDLPVLPTIRPSIYFPFPLPFLYALLSSRCHVIRIMCSFKAWSFEGSG